MELFTVINIVISAFAVAIIWTVVKPQEVENKHMKIAIDNNTAALEKVSQAISALEKQQASSEAHYDERMRAVERDIKELKVCMKELQG